MAFSGEVVFKDEELRKTLAGYLSRMAALSGYSQGGTKGKYVKLISGVVYRDIVDHFKKEEGPEGKWTPWSSSYELCIAGIIFFRRIGSRTVMFFSDEVENPPKPPRNDGKILQTQKGFLRQNFKPSNVRNTSEGLLWFNDAKTKSGFPYAAAHNEGGPKLPARTFMWLSEQAMTDVENNTLQFMLEKEK